MGDLFAHRGLPCSPAGGGPRSNPAGWRCHPRGWRGCAASRAAWRLLPGADGCPLHVHTEQDNTQHSRDRLQSLPSKRGNQVCLVPCLVWLFGNCPREALGGERGARWKPLEHNTPTQRPRRGRRCLKKAWCRGRACPWPMKAELQPRSNELLSNQLHLGITSHVQPDVLLPPAHSGAL